MSAPRACSGHFEIVVDRIAFASVAALLFAASAIIICSSCSVRIGPHSPHVIPCCPQVLASKHVKNNPPQS
eukprot:1810231-Karenia_brevis.AAC.1